MQHATEDLHPGRGRTIIERFEAQAKRTPLATAVVSDEQQLTYAELDARAAAIAQALLAAGVTPGRCVMIAMDRSAATIASLFAVLKVGAAFVPVDPQHPAERLLAMMQDCEAAAVVANSLLGASWSSSVPVVLVDDCMPRLSGMQISATLETYAPDSLAYVMFTSGSTGRPKGVMIDHHSVLNLADALHNAVYEAEGGQLRVSINAPLWFDASIQQLVQLFFGHELWIVPSSVRHDGAALLEFLRVARIDVLDCTPAHLRLLLAAGLLASEGHRPSRVLVGGEALDVATWRAVRADRRMRVYNVYGPTECTVDTTFCLIQTGPDVPVIGRPLPGCEVAVLDGDMRCCAEGKVGEIYVGGAGLARGYLKNEALTQQKFVPDPSDLSGKRRLYKTGDLGYWTTDGVLAFVGRSDLQVKIRGYRIELGDVEATLRRHPGVEDVVVVAEGTGDGENRLVAYLVMGDRRASALELRVHCRKHLPEYMEPAILMRIDALPLTGSGKVDRAALPVPHAARLLRECVYVAPENDIESMLAEAFEDVLKVQPVGRTDNFFDLGGSSLSVVRVMVLTRKRGLHVPFERFVASETIAELASFARLGALAVEAEGGLAGELRVNA